MKKHKGETRTPIGTDLYLPNDSRKDADKSVKALTVGTGTGTSAPTRITKIRRFTATFSVSLNAGPAVTFVNVSISGFDSTKDFVLEADGATDSTEYFLLRARATGQGNTCAFEFVNLNANAQSIGSATYTIWVITA